MKKNVFLAAALIALMAAATYAQTESDFVVSMSSTRATINGYTGSATVVVIPARIQNLPVAIGNDAFFDNTRITSVTIPNGGRIGRYAFQRCTSLTSVTFQGTIEYFGDEPFEGDLIDKFRAGGPGTYTRPNGTSTTWTKQGTAAPAVQYTRESSLTVTRAGNAATITGVTSSLSALEMNHVIIPPTIQNTPVTAIGDRAFMARTIYRITIPTSVTSIGNQAFYACNNLTSVTFEGRIPESGLDRFAFDGDLRAKYLAGGAGTYTRQANGSTWTKQ